jgi:putative Holliday junction resolvase
VGSLANEIAPDALARRTCSVRCLGIDFGTRRIGLAFGDELGVATPLPAIIDADAQKRWATLLAIARQRRATDIVLGHPLNMDDTAGPKAKEAERLAQQLQAELGLPVHLIDERLTSYEAESTIAKAKRRDVRASGLVDSRAATIILQDFLDQRMPPTLPENSTD